MAEETKEQVAVETETKEKDVAQETEVKTFTQEEVDKLIQKRLAKEAKKHEQELQAKLDEAEKLRQMNAEQKAQYEAEQKDKLIKELEAKLNRNGLEKEASKMLSEAGIAVTDEILTLVVKDNAENTQQSVNSFTELVNDLVDKKVSEMLRGKTPKKIEHNETSEITKEQFDRMGYKSRNELLENNPELYAKLAKG